MEKLFEIYSVTKKYHNGKEEIFVLKNVSLSIFKKDYLAITGPSGSGKSTLLHIIGGLEPPTFGEVNFNGKNIYKISDYNIAKWRNKNIGFVFQFYHLIEELNVLENIIIASFDNKKSILKKAEELLKYLDIYNRKDFYPSSLSGGEKQRVAIARALINEPEIILCDEPTGNLDKDSQEKVILLLEKLNKDMGKTIVLVTHNLELANRAKRRIFLKAGELVS